MLSGPTQGQCTEGQEAWALQLMWNAVGSVFAWLCFAMVRSPTAAEECSGGS